MVIVIHQTVHTENALHYNEKKVKEGKAIFFHSRNTLSVNPFIYDEKHRLKNLLDIEKANTRVKNKCLHISFNPSVEDYRKLGEQTIHNEIDRMMEHMGYANQPYFVYKHQDLERVHFHVVSTRIDLQTGRKIKDNYEKQKMQKFVQELEQKYDLSNKQTKEQPDFKFSPRSRNIKQNLENLFAHLNQIQEITSREMYNEALKLFNVEIKKSGRGHIVLVTDEEGNSEVIYEIGTFHPAPGAQITYDLCTVCHSEMIIAQQGQTREGWDEILVWMVEEMGMAELPEDEREQVLDYLSTYYNPDRPYFPGN